MYEISKIKKNTFRKKIPEKSLLILLPFTKFTQTIQQTQSQPFHDPPKNSNQPFGFIKTDSFSENDQLKKKSFSEHCLKANKVDPLNKLLNSLEDQFRQTKKQVKCIQQSNFLLIDQKNHRKVKYHSLSKQRSVSNKNYYSSKSSFTQQKMIKQIKSSKSSEWLEARNLQKQKQQKKIQNFDHEKINRNVDHLGRLKKSRLNRSKMNGKFVQLKNYSKQIDFIDKQMFEKTCKQFHAKFKHIQAGSNQQSNKMETKNILTQQKQVLKTPNPKAKKKYNIRYNLDESVQAMAIKKKKKHFRVSADENIFKNGYEEELREFSNGKKSNSLGNSSIQTESIMDLKEEAMVSQECILSKFKEGQAENYLQNNKISISSNTHHLIVNKIYFLLPKPLGYDSLFSIEKINLKARHYQNLVIEVVFQLIKVLIKANEQIIACRINYGKNKRTEAFKKFKMTFEKDVQKQKLKTQILSIFSKQSNTQTNFLQKFSTPASKKYIQRNSSDNQLSNHFNEHGNEIKHTSEENIRQNKSQHIVHLKQSLSLQKLQQNAKQQKIKEIEQSNALELKDQTVEYQKQEFIVEKKDVGFTQQSMTNQDEIGIKDFSPVCYQTIIPFIKRYFNLENSYLGLSLKQIDKKRFHLEQNFLESNTQQIFYFIIKINATYYLAKTELFQQKKIKFFLLFELSLMKKHQKNLVIIKEEELLNENLGKIKKQQLAEQLFFQSNKIISKIMRKDWNKNREKTNFKNETIFSKIFQQQKSLGSQNFPPLCHNSKFTNTIKIARRKYEINKQQSLFNITQLNYRNDTKWKKQDYFLSQDPIYKNCFEYHNSFDYQFNGVFNQSQPGKQTINNSASILLSSCYVDSFQIKQRIKNQINYEYYVTKTFDINIAFYPSAVKSKQQLLRYHPILFRNFKIEDKFKKQQLVLLHANSHLKTSLIESAFLKKQLIKWIAKRLNLVQKGEWGSPPFLTMLKNQYWIKVYLPSLSLQSVKLQESNIIRQKLYVQFQSRVSTKKYSKVILISNILKDLKEYYKLKKDQNNLKSFSFSANSQSPVGFNTVKSFFTFFICHLKTYISNLQLISKYTYSQLYFIPSFTQQQIQNKSASTLKKLSIQPKIHQISQNTKNFPQPFQKFRSVYQIHYKTIKKLFSGWFIIISIYSVPIFDLSEIKIYVTKMKKSFYLTTKRNLEQSQFKNIVVVLFQFLKDKFFRKIIFKEMEKLLLKNKEFFYRIRKPTENSFSSKSCLNKEIFANYATRFTKSRRAKPKNKNYAISQMQFNYLTEQLLRLIFESRQQIKYLIRFSFSPSNESIQLVERKGIDELINVNIMKNNCMMIYKFQTTIRRIIQKKITSKCQQFQLDCQQKRKHLYVLFEEIKILINGSDQTTEGLLNTFKNYFISERFTIYTTHKNISFISMNRFAEISRNRLTNKENSSFLSESNIFESALPKIANNDQQLSTQKNCNLKNLSMSLYQRFRLFVNGNFMLDVLQIGNKNKNPQNISQQNFSKFNFKPAQSSKSFRAKNRRQSIQDYLSEKSIESQGSLKGYETPFSQYQHQKAINKIEMTSKADQFIEDVDQIKKCQLSNKNFQQKLVYLINTEGESMMQIPSSQFDQGFTINVPFGAYNEKMFKRLFKEIIKKCQIEGFQAGYINHREKINQQKGQLSNFQMFF